MRQGVCKFGTSCRNNLTTCPFSHPGANNEETKETELTIFEKGKIIQEIITLIGQKCKFNQECTAYKCVYEHDTVTCYSPKANVILETIMKINNKKEEEEKKKKEEQKELKKRQKEEIKNQPVRRSGRISEK